MMRGSSSPGGRANAEFLHRLRWGTPAGGLRKGARMADNLPWVLQLLETDRKLKRFQEVLAAIAGVEAQLNAMDPDRALAVLRAVTRAARVALENTDMRQQKS
jgi:hypothetical protein